jgi:hypothetical protein
VDATLIVKSYVTSAAWLISAFAAAVIVGAILRRKVAPAAQPRVKVGLNIAGTIVAAVAAMSKLGWVVQTWDGDSPIEKLNNRVFFSVGLTGLWLVLTSRVLDWFHAKQR